MQHLAQTRMTDLAMQTPRAAHGLLSACVAIGSFVRPSHPVFGEVLRQKRYERLREETGSVFPNRLVLTANDSERSATVLLGFPSQTTELANRSGAFRYRMNWLLRFVGDCFANAIRFVAAPVDLRFGRLDSTGQVPFRCRQVWFAIHDVFGRQRDSTEPMCRSRLPYQDHCGCTQKQRVQGW